MASQRMINAFAQGVIVERPDVTAKELRDALNTRFLGDPDYFKASMDVGMGQAGHEGCLVGCLLGPIFAPLFHAWDYFFAPSQETLRKRIETAIRTTLPSRNP